MNFLKHILKNISLLFYLIKINIKEYPLFDILLQNNHTYTREDKDDLVELMNNSISFKYFCINSFENQHTLLENLLDLANVEKFYIKNKNTSKKILPEFSLVLQILLDAKNAIEKLENIHKSDKKIAYYESSKNANLDDLITHFTKRLHLKGEDEMSFEFTKQEVKIKRFVTRLKKRHTLFLNYYLSILKMFDLNKIKVSKDDSSFLKGIVKMIEFFTLGHAQEKQIHKSVAIQIYFIYKNKLSHTELIEIIGNIIDIVFETETPYKNFQSFNQEQVYIKNRVDNFILFEIDDTLNKAQTEKMNDFFEKNILKQSIFFKLKFIKNIIHLMVHNPLFFMLYMEQMKSFGFSPIKK